MVDVTVRRHPAGRLYELPEHSVPPIDAARPLQIEEDQWLDDFVFSFVRDLFKFIHEFLHLPQSAVDTCQAVLTLHRLAQFNVATLCSGDLASCERARPERNTPWPYSCAAALLTGPDSLRCSGDDLPRLDGPQETTGKQSSANRHHYSGAAKIQAFRKENCQRNYRKRGQ